MKRLTNGLQALLGLGLVTTGVVKIMGAAEGDRDRLAIAAWLWVVAGAFEVAGGFGMLAGFRWPRLAVPAGVGIAALAAGALGAHVRAEDAPAVWLYPVIVGGMALVVAAVRSGRFAAPDRNELTPIAAGD